jgi:predicted dehydrogenase
VQLSPTFRRLWTPVADGEIGRVHAARAHYDPGSTWARWYHEDALATLGDVGIYSLKSLAALLGPVREVTAMAATALPERRAGDTGAGDAGAYYRRAAIELYGTAGTANLLGDDWDPRGLELWREAAQAWELREPDDATWLWTDGLRGGGRAAGGPGAALERRARRAPDRGDRGGGRERRRGAAGGSGEPLRAVGRAAPGRGRARPPRARPHAARPTSSSRPVRTRSRAGSGEPLA